MVSINTNISSLIVQSSLNKSTSNLETALERLSTGFRINHAKDDAAGYSIASNLTTKINSYLVAEDNILSGIDLLTTASETIELMTNQILRLRDIATQAQNGTYDTQSLSALNLEAENIISELERLRTSTEYNGIPLFESTTQATQATPTPPVTEIRTVGIEKESDDEITTNSTYTATGNTTLGTFLNFDTLKEIDIKDSAGLTIATESFDDNNTINDLLTFARRNGLNASITDGVITINSSTGLYLEDRTSNGVLDALGTIGSVVNLNGTQTISVKNQNGVEQAQYGITQTTTFDDLFTFLNQHGISGDITNGVITLTSTSNYVEDLTTNGILSQLGITTHEDVTGQTVYQETTSSHQITYKVVSTSLEYNTTYRAATESDVFFAKEDDTYWITNEVIVYLLRPGEYVTPTNSTGISFNLLQTSVTYGDAISVIESLGGNNVYMQDGNIYYDPIADYNRIVFVHAVDNGVEYEYWEVFYPDGSGDQQRVPTSTRTITTTTTTTQTATASTKLSDLGLTSDYVVTADSGDGWTITWTGDTTLQDIMDYLEDYTLLNSGEATLSNGYLTIDALTAEYIANKDINIPEPILAALGLNITGIEITTTQISNTTSNTPLSLVAVCTVDTSTTLSELGITNTQYITIAQNGTREIITLRTSDTADDILTSLNNYGITASLSSQTEDLHLRETQTPI